MPTGERRGWKSSAPSRETGRPARSLDVAISETVVGPGADGKLYVTASPQVRAEPPPVPNSPKAVAGDAFRGDRGHPPTRRARQEPRRDRRSSRPTTRTCLIPSKMD